MKYIVGLFQVVFLAIWWYQPETGLFMAGPAVIPLIIASTAFTAFSQYRQAQGQEAIAEYNAKVSEQEANARERAAGVEAEQFRKEGKALQATQRVQFGRSGVLAATGAPLNLMAETAKELELDRQMILAGGAAEASRFRSQAVGQRMQGEAAMSAGRGAALGSVLGGLSSAAQFKALTAKPPKTPTVYPVH